MGYFQNIIDNFEIVHDDVFMRPFAKYLVGNVALWFRNMESCSICSWIGFHGVFLRYWSENKSYDQFISKFYSLIREKDEVVVMFNKRFYNLYLNMPMEIQPSKIVSMVQYTIAQHPDLVLFLIERMSSSL